jgi:hypothetical protein
MKGNRTMKKVFISRTNVVFYVACGQRAIFGSPFESYEHAKMVAEQSGFEVVEQPKKVKSNV